MRPCSRCWFNSPLNQLKHRRFACDFRGKHEQAAACTPFVNTPSIDVQHLAGVEHGEARFDEELGNRERPFGPYTERVVTLARSCADALIGVVRGEGFDATPFDPEALAGARGRELARETPRRSRSASRLSAACGSTTSSSKRPRSGQPSWRVRRR